MRRTHLPAFVCMAMLALGVWISMRPSASNLAASPAAKGIRLEDATESAGIRFQHRNGATGEHYYVETMSGGCAFLDYDSDGWQDIFFTQGATLPDYRKPGQLHCALYHNNRDGTFTDVTAGSGLDIPIYALGVAVGDYDNDGRPDLYVTTLGGSRLFHNDTPGRAGAASFPDGSEQHGDLTRDPRTPGAERPRFRDVTRNARVAANDMSTSAAWLDYDGDGRLDLFVCRYMDYDLATNPRCKNKRGLSGYCSPNVYAGTQCVLFRNNGDGTFLDVSKQSGIARLTGRSLGVVCADYNGDELIDIFVSNDLSPNYLFINRGDGSFREQAALAGVAYGEAGVARAGMGVDAADYHNEGSFSIAVTNFENEPTALFRNNGKGAFTEESFPSGVGRATLPFLKWGCRFVDLDLDGWQDLFVANGHVDDYADDSGEPQGYAQASQVLRNDGGGVFSDVSEQCGPFFSRKLVARGMAVGDYDNDGKADILLACNNGRAVLLRNQTLSADRGLRVMLKGTGCNRDAIGAVVTVSAGSTRQMQIVRSGSSYLSDHDRRLLFAVGAASSARVEVRWPCGARETREADSGASLVVRERVCSTSKKEAKP